MCCLLLSELIIIAQKGVKSTKENKKSKQTDKSQNTFFQRALHNSTSPALIQRSTGHRWIEEPLGFSYFDISLFSQS